MSSVYKHDFYWSLALFYAFFFSVWGLMAPYWGLYLQSLSLSAFSIGVLSSLMSLNKVLAPNVWAWLADVKVNRRKIVMLAACCAWVSVSLFILLPKKMLVLILVLWLFSFFWHAILPQVEVITLSALGKHAAHYSQIRLWGSVGFIGCVLLAGLWFEQHSISHLPVILWGLLLVIIACCFVLPKQNNPSPNQHSATFMQQLRQPVVLCVLLACALMQMSHGAFYTFFSIFLEQAGHSKALIGRLWAWGVLAEIILFLYLPKFINYRSNTFWLLLALLLAAVRWVLIGLFAQAVWMMFLAQTLHAATYGLFHVAAMQQVRAGFSANNTGRALAIYSSMSFGLGGAFGALGAGVLWDVVGGQWVFVLSALVACLGMVLVGLMQAKSKV